VRPDGSAVACVWSDLGVANAQIVENLVAEASSNGFDYILNSGDYA
jgi:hypothetical protein